MKNSSEKNSNPENHEVYQLPEIINDDFSYLDKVEKSKNLSEDKLRELSSFRAPQLNWR